MAWFDRAFPWIGLLGAVVLLALMFGTDLLQGQHAISRWQDLTWLSWAATAVYLLHNVEEYGIDLHGKRYSFAKAVCKMFGYSSVEDSPAVPAFFTAVNVPMFWFIGPLAALMSKQHPLVGLTLYSVMSINILVHAVSSFAEGRTYNPGLLTAIVLFLPLTIWAFRAMWIEGVLNGRSLAYILGWGVIVHVVLIGTVLLMMKRISRSSLLLVGAQYVNAALLIVVPMLAEQWAGTPVA